jgi:hypothetical protein
VFAHAVRVDPQDNIWAVDEGSNMVIKFNPEGRVVMTWAEGRSRPMHRRPAPPPAPANPGKYIFDRPTDVGWDADGNIFVTDGYGNSRVVKYDKNGRFMAQAGLEGVGAGASSICRTRWRWTPRATSMWGPEQSRIQVFDNDLKFKTIYDNVGTPGRFAFLRARISISSRPTHSPTNDYTLATVTGEVYKMELDGTIVSGKFGKAGKQLGEFSGLHEIDCRNPDELYISEIQLWRVQKIILHPEREIEAP